MDTFSFLSQKSIFIPFIFVFFKDYAYFQWTFLFPMKYMKYYNAGLFKKIKLCFSGYTYNNSYTKVEIK
ncbi:MAG: hypothetical protein MJ252_04940 [archaeon]|nr:hypothetical protein [archaeon]